MRPEELDRDDPRSRFAFSGLPLCWNCYRYVGAMTCRAFSKFAPGIDIPDEIMSCIVVHDQPYPGDKGRQYVPKDADPPPEGW